MRKFFKAETLRRVFGTDGAEMGGLAGTNGGMRSLNEVGTESNKPRV